jgi:hypothetical protein
MDDYNMDWWDAELASFPSGYSDIFSPADFDQQTLDAIGQITDVTGGVGMDPTSAAMSTEDYLASFPSGYSDVIPPEGADYVNRNPTFRPSQDSQLANEMLQDQGYVAQNPALQGFVNDMNAAPPQVTQPAVPTNASGSTWERLLSALGTPGGLAALLAGASMLSGIGRGGGSSAPQGAGLFKGTIPNYRATRTEMPNRPSNADIRNFATVNINDPRTIANAMQRFGLNTADIGRAAPEIPQEDIENYFRQAGIQQAGRRPGSAPLRYFSGVQYEGRAAGGLVGLANQQAQPFPMQSNGFVLPADVVSALGNGSSRAGAERVQGMLGGGRVIDGPGDGQSDSIPAHIDGRQPAAVARDEMYLSPEEVARIGGGDTNRGVAALHRMMDNVRKQAYGHTNQQRPVDPRKLA